MNLKLGTKVLWLHSFAIGVFMLQNYVFAIWFTGLLFGTTLHESNPLWFLELMPYFLWALELLILGGIWNYIPTPKEAERVYLRVEKKESK